ncbi:MAG: monovalent cation:proton antiporter-2 (CPA2) family protein [Pseudomonadota bacterium]
MSQVEQALIYIAAAVIAVPLAKRLGFGSVLGYLAAGIVIGPAALGLISDVEYVLHFAELGVVFLLFIIGLELKPARLWVLRRQVFGFGSAQVFLTAIPLGIIAWLSGQAVNAALVIGFGLALSSTAFVLQLLAEQKQMFTEQGRTAFAVLLFQDLAVIPLIALVPLLATNSNSTIENSTMIFSLAAVLVLVFGGRYLLRPILRLAARTEIKELFTATALLVVLGAAVLMEHAHLSMGLGAFIAGMLLADSEYRHELETTIEPFKGLLLGLFFIAVGMSVNLSLIASRPLDVFGYAILLIVVKAVVVFALAKLFGLRTSVGRALAVILAQGGEFAFVLFTLARQSGVLGSDTVELLMVVVTLTMACTPFLFLANEAWAKRQQRAEQEPEYDAMEPEQNAVIIASFGRFGQIVGRLLSSRGIGFTALESNIEQVEVVRRYGNRVYYGDAGRVDLLRAAGTGDAKFFVLAIDDVEQSLKTARTVRKHFPDLPILARARNRFHAHLLMDLGITMIFRDTFYSSLELSRELLSLSGTDPNEAKAIVDTFAKHDEDVLKRQHAFRQDETRMIQTAHEAARELEGLLKADAQNSD